MSCLSGAKVERRDMQKNTRDASKDADSHFHHYSPPLPLQQLSPPVKCFNMGNGYYRKCPSPVKASNMQHTLVKFKIYIGQQYI